MSNPFLLIFKQRILKFDPKKMHHPQPVMQQPALSHFGFTQLGIHTPFLHVYIVHVLSRGEQHKIA